MRAKHAGKQMAHAPSLRRWPAIVLIAAPIIILAATANTQEAANVGARSGTLKKIKDTGTITLGYRESSLPFSYLNRRQQPIGYSIDLCREIVGDVSTELDGMEIKIAFTPVTPANRLQKVASGEIDLECGSTTGNVQRRKEVAFSPIFFIAGTKLLVPRSSSISSYRDLRDKTVVVTAGTTNEEAVRAISDKQHLGIKFLVGKDHAESFALLKEGKADAFATDDVLLYGLVAQSGSSDQYHVVGEYLSYDPYGLMYRKDDPDFAEIVDRTFTRLARSRELVQLYNKWFQQRLPTGETLDLPMSPELEEIFRVEGVPE